MRKTRTILVVLVTLLLALVLVAPVVAAEEDLGCVSIDKVEKLRYVFMDDQPIPLDVMVEFVSVCETYEVAMKWEEPLGNGFISHYYIYQGVSIDYIEFDRPGVSSSTEYRDPRPGDEGQLRYVEDWYGNREDTLFDEDGIVDSMAILQLREWTDVELQLIEFGNQFYNEAVEKGFFYLRYATDCSPTYYRMNGARAQEGPYGKTYMVPEGGGLLEAFYEAGTCGWYEEDTIRWSYWVEPGDGLSGTEDVTQFSMKDPDPWYFCSRLDWMYPVWQPSYVFSRVESLCSNLHGLSDKDAIALLARNGYLRADTRYGDVHPEGFVPFVQHSSVGMQKAEHLFEGITWHEVAEDVISVYGSVYQVVVNDDYDWPLFVASSVSVEGSTVHSSDIPWHLGWDAPLLFVPDSEMDDYSFDITDGTLIFRVRRIGSDVIVEQGFFAD